MVSTPHTEIMLKLTTMSHHTDLQVGNAGNDIFQKMKSLRMRIRDKKHDRFGQNIGYTMGKSIKIYYQLALVDVLMLLLYYRLSYEHILCVLSVQ